MACQPPSCLDAGGRLAACPLVLLTELLMQSVLRLDLRCELGEGIAWHLADRAWPEDGFFFVDIHRRRLHFVREDGEGHRSWLTPERIGWVISTRHGGHLLAGLQSGVARFT